MSAKTKTTKPAMQPQPRKKTLDPQRASLMGQIGGNTTKARYGGYEMTRRAREALADSWLRKADPKNVLPLAERAQRAEALRQAHYAKMRLARWNKSDQQKKAS